MSQIKVNSIVPIAGLSAGASGGIIQIVQAVKTDKATVNVAQGVSSDMATSGVGNLSPQMAVSNSSNKVLIILNISVGVDMTGTIYMTPTVGGSPLAFRGDADGNRQRTGSATRPGSSGSMNTVNAVYLYSPGTTNTLTYGVAFGQANDQTQAIRINHQGGTNVNYNATAASSITLMEVSV
tara:strand:- start:279 stop:821 length:543 start_codon:yes stop_codon:yes gene_type:complete